MKILQKCVLLLKSEKENSNDKFESSLLQNGFTVTFLKTLVFKFINLTELEEKLNKANDYEGIIFTTPRTVKGIQEIDNFDLNVIKYWKEKSNYVVGETTNNLVKKELDLPYCVGQESGNASNLADVILKGKDKIVKPFLYPCGSLKTDTLINKLGEHHIQVDDIIIYETISNPTLQVDFETLTNNLTAIPEYWVYFSPSGVRSTTHLFEKLNADIHSLIKFIAIGPTTNTALVENNIKVKAVCQKPTPEDLISAILD